MLVRAIHVFSSGRTALANRPCSRPACRITKAAGRNAGRAGRRHAFGPAIEACGLTRRFGDFTAVDRVSLEIQRGEIFGFLGSNGCGKTTTMKVLTGLLPASEGEALLFFGTAIYLTATASIGIFLGTVSRSMAQFALLVLMTIIPMMLLSGGTTPMRASRISCVRSPGYCRRAIMWPFRPGLSSAGLALARSGLSF